MDAIALLSDLRLGSGECSLERFQIGRFNQYGYGFAASRVAQSELGDYHEHHVAPRGVNDVAGGQVQHHPAASVAVAFVGRRHARHHARQPQLETLIEDGSLTQDSPRMRRLLVVYDDGSNTSGTARCARRSFSVVESSAQKIRTSKACKSGLMGAMASRRRFVGGAQSCRTSKNVPTSSNMRSRSNMRAAASLLVAKPAAARNRSCAAALK